MSTSPVLAPPLPTVTSPPGAMTLVGYAPATPAALGLLQWQGLATHTHMLRSRETSYEAACHNLVAWCRQHQVAALGVGSPWEPVSAAAYGRYEGPDRDLYYAPDFDPQTVKHEAAIAAHLHKLNVLAAGYTHFYLDNETPKSRFGHLWWLGWHYDFPAWHDYSQDRPIMYYQQDPHRELNARTGLPHRRRPYLEIVASQRAAGALAVWAHPTSWWYGHEQSFVTNIAAELPLHLAVDGGLDGLAVMGYDACHRGYQALWWDLLDRGYRVPGTAECDLCFDLRNLLDRPRALLSYCAQPGALTVPGMQAALRHGCLFASTGARLQVNVDGVPMGGTALTSPAHGHTVRLDLAPRAPDTGFARVEVLGRGGAVRLAMDHCPGGSYTFHLPGGSAADYVVVRAWGQHEDPAAPQQKILDFCLSNPVYLRPAHEAGPQPVVTQLTLQVAPTSIWCGGTVVCETAAGLHLWTSKLPAGEAHEQVPAGARIRLIAPDGRQDLRYVAMENERVQALLRYLHDGEFRRDYPELHPGEVPPAAFRISEMAEAVSTCVVRI